MFTVANERRIVHELQWKVYWKDKHDKLLAVSKQQDTTIKYCLADRDNCKAQNVELTTQKNIRDKLIGVCEEEKIVIKKEFKKKVTTWQIISGAEFIIIAALAISAF